MENMSKTTNTSRRMTIQKLNAEIVGIVARQNKLRTGIDEIVAALKGK
jgi:hypothetical protein